MAAIEKKLLIDSISYWTAQVGAVIVLLGMMCLVTTDVILRDILNSPIVGANDYTTLMMMMLTSLSLSYCWTQRGHVRMELFVRSLSNRGQNICWALAALVGTIVFGMMTIKAIHVVFEAFEYEEITFEANVTLWPFRIIFAAGICLFTLQLFTDFIRYLIKTFTENSAA